MCHPNAFLTARGRLRLAECAVDQCWSLRRAAERFLVSVPTAARWTERCREHGPRNGGPFQPLALAGETNLAPSW